MTDFAKKDAFDDETFKKDQDLLNHKNLQAKSFSHCVFDSIDFTGGNFCGSKFADCSFVNCNVSLVKFDGSRLQNVTFEDCKVVGANFCKCDPLFLFLKFKKSVLKSCNFSDLNLKETVFSGCSVQDTYFTSTNLAQADFSHSDLKGSMFHNTVLTKANFQRAINYSIHPLNNKLKGALFSQPEVLSLLDSFQIVIE